MDEPKRHEWHIEDREYARHEQRRGRRHAYETLDAEHTALVVVDMVPFFADQNPYAAGIIPNVNQLALALRTAGGTVAWVTPSNGPATPHNIEFFGEDVARTYAESGGNGALATGLEHDRSDLTVVKSTPSAFFPGGSSLHDVLVALGIDTVLIAGTVANVCCESTARDASALGYRTIMVADANAAVRDTDLNATLRTIYRSFGDVRPTDELIALLGT